MPDRHTLGEDVVRRMQLEHEQDVVARMVPRQRIPEALVVSAEEVAMERTTASVEVVDGWTVREINGLWVADHPEHGFLRDKVDGRYPAQYNTRAQLIEHLTGKEATP